MSDRNFAATTATFPITMQGKYQTRNGRAVRILCVDGPGFEPVIGIVEGEDEPDVWTPSGSWYSGDREGPWDILPVPTKHEAWMAISNKSGLPLADARRGVWLDRGDAVAFCNQADEHVVLVTWFF